MNQARRPAPARRNPWITRGITAAVVIALVAGGAWYWQQKAGEEEAAFRTVAVERGDIRVAISSTGTLSAISTVTVGSQVSGQVTDVLVDFNDVVTKDQVIARIDPATYEAQIEQGAAQVASAQATLRQAQATLKNADVDFRRKQSLSGQQLVAASDVDLARAARDQASASVSAAQAQIRQQTASTQATRINLGRTVIRSPVDGVVLTRTVEPGQTVAASLQAPELFTIAEDLSKMQIVLAVDEADIGQVKTGQNVSFTVDAFPDRQFRGVVQQVRLSATNTSNVITYPVVVTVDNADGTLLPGLTVNAEIEVSKRDGVLKVSNAALRFKPSDEQAAALAKAGAGAGSGGAASAGAGGGRGGGTQALEDLGRVAAGLRLDAAQKAAFDTAVAAMRERAQKRQAAGAAGGAAPGGSRAFGGGPGGGPPGVTVRVSSGAGGGNTALQAQMRQRMQQRMQQDFAAFRATLDATQATAWDTALAAQGNAKRITVYKLVDGSLQPATVRVGVTDGTSTELSGKVAQGDLLVAGAKAKQ